MRAVVQRVSRASLAVDGQLVGEIGAGLLVLLGVGPDDGEAQVAWLAAKVAKLRVFPDAEGKMSLSAGDIGGGVLVVSQFTLYGDVRKGNRPSFTGAAPPALAEPLVERFCEAVAAEGLPVGRGRFGAHMEVALTNDGPVTLVVDTP